jgi:hypothetical protein
MGDEYKPILSEESEPSKSKLRYNIGKLYADAFPSLASQALFKLEGVKDLAKDKITEKIGYGFKIPQEEQKALNLDWTGVKNVQVSEANAFSYLGTPIFHQIKLKAGNYYIIENGKAVLKNFPTDLILPATTTVDINRTKVIAKTQINGNTGTVKEMWGFSDWEVTVRGIIITEGENEGNNANIFPEKEITSIMEYENIADSIEVSGGMFGILKIKRLCIEKVTLSQVTGMPNIIPFQFNCTSDEAEEIIFKNNQLGN